VCKRVKCGERERAENNEKMNDSPAAQVYVLVGDTANEPKKMLTGQSNVGGVASVFSIVMF